MNKTILLIVVMWFVTSLTSCKKATVVDNDNSSQTVPIISIASPLNNSAVTDSVLITASTTNDSAIVKVEFYIDGNLGYTCSKTPWQYNWNVRSLTPNTIHTIQVKAYTKSNSVVISQLVSVNIKQTVDPTISIVTPTNNSTVLDSVLITASTTNDSVIVKVEFYINDKFVYVCSNTPWQYYWNFSDQTQNGTYKIQVKAITKTNTTVLSQIVYVFAQKSIEFVYPLAIGNSWKYRSYYEDHITAILHAPYKTGIHTLNVIGQSSSNDSTFYWIEYVRQDTQRYRDDTNFVSINRTTSQFAITKTKEEYIIENVFSPLTDVPIILPRNVIGTDTIIIDDHYGTYYKFLTNCGLLQFSLFHAGNSTMRDSLNLISFVIQ